MFHLGHNHSVRGVRLRLGTSEINLSEIFTKRAFYFEMDSDLQKKMLFTNLKFVQCSLLEFVQFLTSLHLELAPNL